MLVYCQPSVLHGITPWQGETSSCQHWVCSLLPLPSSFQGGKNSRRKYNPSRWVKQERTSLISCTFLAKPCCGCGSPVMQRDRLWSLPAPPPAVPARCSRLTRADGPTGANSSSHSARGLQPLALLGPWAERNWNGFMTFCSNPAH